MSIFKTIFSKKAPSKKMNSENIEIEQPLYKLQGSKSTGHNLLENGLDENTDTPEVPVKESKKTLSKNKITEYTMEETCENLLESMKQLEELKVEYHAVTAYLTDIQKIDGIFEDEKEVLVEAARKIVTSTREKAAIQTTGKRVSDSIYKNIEYFEDELPGEMKRMKENEIYFSKIEKDMKHLEGEKASLSLQKEDTSDRINYLKKIGVLTGVLIVILFAIFIVIDVVFSAKLTIPLLLTILMGTVVGAYIMIQAMEYKKEGKQLDLKYNRAITLLNSVKIKYINTKNALDYAYQKYSIKSYTELLYLWEQYNKAKEDEKKYSKHSEIIEFEKKQLLSILKDYQLEDPGIWAYQAVALIDNKEMVEVRHNLNVRRQKLRDSMDYNNNIKEVNTKNVKEYLDKRPEDKEIYEPLLRKYGVYL